MKKGFTLIELLAVILILGIIALIAIPTVNNILKEARRGAFSSTLSNIEKAVENECTLSQIKNKNINYTYTITDGAISPSIEIKGNLPDGTIYVDGECKVSYTLYNNNFSAVKNNEEVVINNEKIYTESILNGAVPVLSNNLIPVTIDNDGTVRKANIYEKWYSYEEKIWANAVILNSTGRIEDDGTILEESIESYFVWIPRYKYKLFNMGNYNSIIQSESLDSKAIEIEVIFENKNTEISNGDEVGEYLSHPAFQAFDTNGFWVAKFEISKNENSLNIKPNQKSLTNLNVKSFFELSLNYKKENMSHMIKSTEWAAASYLSHSRYGINKEVNINNNSLFMTGYSATIEADQTIYPGIYGFDSTITLPYNTDVGYQASTTGNISGIYDMSGCSHEYVAAYNNSRTNDQSGFVSDPVTLYGKKYFDKYEGENDVYSYYNRILGDATGELGPFYRLSFAPYNSWYRDDSYFVDSVDAWQSRGGRYASGYLGGQMSFYRANGGAVNTFGSRLVLIN